MVTVKVYDPSFTLLSDHTLYSPLYIKRDYYSILHHLSSPSVKVRSHQGVIEVFDHKYHSPPTHRLIKKESDQQNTHRHHYAQKAIALQSYTAQKLRLSSLPCSYILSTSVE